MFSQLIFACVFSHQHHPTLIFLGFLLSQYIHFCCLYLFQNLFSHFHYITKPAECIYFVLVTHFCIQSTFIPSIFSLRTQFLLVFLYSTHFLSTLFSVQSTYFYVSPHVLNSPFSMTKGAKHTLVQSHFLFFDIHSLLLIRSTNIFFRICTF